MTQTIKCDTCGTAQDANQVYEESAQQSMMQAQMQQFGMETQYSGWVTIYGKDFCPRCLEKYRERANPIKEEVDKKLREIVADMVGTESVVKLGSVH